MNEPKIGTGKEDGQYDDERRPGTRNLDEQIVFIRLDFGMFEGVPPLKRTDGESEHPSDQVGNGPGIAHLKTVERPDDEQDRDDENAEIGDHAGPMGEYSDPNAIDEDEIDPPGRVDQHEFQIAHNYSLKYLRIDSNYLLR